MAKSVAVIASSPIFDILNGRLARASAAWNAANARYIKARVAYDSARLVNTKAEALLYVAFAQAKADVKAATDAYYAITASLTAVRTAISAAKTEQQIAELEKRLDQERQQLLKLKG